MKIKFRYANQQDLPAIVETYNSTIPSRLVTADLEPVTVDSRKDWFHSHSPEKRPLWIVSLDDQYAGWMSFKSFYGRPAYDGTVEMSIYLEESCRNKGVGQACIEQALNEAPGLKIHTLLGFIFGHNTPSLNLFYKNGFEKWAQLPEVADMDGKMIDLIILGRKVG